jgi:putative ABC transport system permease protein
MKYLTILKQSIKAIFANKGRSFLTVLGIIIGIGSVIALISLGNGVQASINTQIGKLGATNLTITPGSSRFSGGGSTSNKQSTPQGPAASGGGFGSTSTLTVKDLNSLTSSQPNLRAATGAVNGTAVFTVSGVEQRDTVVGTNTEYFSIHSLKINNGKLFAQSDIDSKTKVIVLGSTLANDVFPGVDPMGKTVTVGKDTYTVIGVMAKADESSFLNPNLNAYIPYTSAMTTFGTDVFNSMMAQAKNEGVIDAAKADVEKTLLANHGITDPKLADFSVMTSKDLLSTIGNITGIITSLLAGIAAISLVVGGIGIMNIMLVSVTERTREIGLRKAVGAKTSDILLQFIIEAVVLTLAGGILGIGLGYLIGIGAAKFLNFTPIVTFQAILLAVGVSSAVGLVFGIYPAAKAARLNPIDALRYE